MAGTPENEDPRAFVNAPAEEVVTSLVRLIRQLRPEVIMTFEPYGGYGHPDHIAIHHHTVAAFHAAADPAQYPELGSAWQAKRLFYTAISRSFFQDMRRLLVESGLDTKEMERFNDPKAGWPDEAVNVSLDVSQTVEVKWQALQCHRTQFGPDNLFRRLPEDRAKRLMSQEFFALAWPEPRSGLRLPDLFAGV